MVLAVADQHEVGVAGVSSPNARIAWRTASPIEVPRRGDAVGRGVVEALQEQPVVARQRALHVGAAGEGRAGRAGGRRRAAPRAPARAPRPWPGRAGSAPRPRPACCADTSRSTITSRPRSGSSWPPGPHCGCISATHEARRGGGQARAPAARRAARRSAGSTRGASSPVTNAASAWRRRRKA